MDVATFNPSKQEAKGGSDEAQDSIVLSMSNKLLYLVPELHTYVGSRVVGSYLFTTVTSFLLDTLLGIL